MIQFNLHRLPDGSFLDYGRHWRAFGKEGSGPALCYSGEAAEVIELVLRYQKGNDDA